MRFLYFLFTTTYRLGIAIAAPFNNKAKLWIKGRKGLFTHLKGTYREKKKVVWFHCASLGEFEQGKPLIMQIRKQHPELFIHVTFFSPSGYEIKKNDSCADLITYLPMDTPGAARKFIQALSPIAAIFVKYEYWYGYMQELSRRDIPFYYISAIYRPQQIFFKKYGTWFSDKLAQATHIFVQNRESQELLNSIGITQVSVAGDTRFDQVYRIAEDAEPLEFVEQFKQNKKLIVAGSTWLPDEKVLQEVHQQTANSYKMIIAPHEIENSHIEQIKKLFPAEKTICYSEIEGQNLNDYNILIINKIGILKKIYRYSEISYIGGAFQTGLHNILEAAVFGVPIFFGPQYQKFDEAKRLVLAGGAFSITDSNQMLSKISIFDQNEEEYKRVCTICQNFVQSNLGATDILYQHISKTINL